MSTPPPTQRRRPFQFSVATLIAAMTFVAVAMAVLFSFAWWLSSILLFVLSVVYPPVVLAGILYAPGQQRTFFIGAAVPLVISILSDGSRQPLAYFTGMFLGDLLDQFFESPGIEYFGSILGLLAASLICGWVCVRARRYWEHRAP